MIHARALVGATATYPFHSPFRALLWKEWREMRRQFVGCFLILTVLPAVLAAIYQVADFGVLDTKDLGEMIAILLSGVMVMTSIPLAAGWGASSVCRDLLTERAGFVLARPISSRSVLLAKALMSLTLMGTLFVLNMVFLAAIFGVQSESEAAISGIRRESEVVEIGTAITMMAGGLAAVSSFSFLCAVLIRRLVPSILLGIASAVGFIVAPMVWLDYTGDISRYGLTLGIGAALLILAGIFLAMACWRGWAANRRAVSNRTLAWVTVILILMTTAAVSDSMATDTRIVATFGDWSSPMLLGSDKLGVYWLSYAPPSGKSAIPVVHRTRFDVNGQPTDTQAIRLVGLEPLQWGFKRRYQYVDFSNLLLVESDSKQTDLVQTVTKFDLNFDKPEAVGVQIAKPNWTTPQEPTVVWNFDLVRNSGWCYFNDKLFGPMYSKDWHGVIGSYDPQDVGKPGVPVSYSVAERAKFIISLNLLHCFSYRNEGRNSGVLDHALMFRSEGGNLIHGGASDSLKLRGQNEGDMSDPMSFVAMKDNRVAVSTDRGLGLYQLNSGHWTELGWRPAGILEILAGRSRSSVVWKDNYIYETTYFGLVVYDVSSPQHPRRIAHTQHANIGVAAPIDDRHFVIRGRMNLEVHRLPK